MGLDAANVYACGAGDAKSKENDSEFFWLVLTNI
jgi:hypothetical protein